MYNAVIYYAQDRKQYSIIIGQFNNFSVAEKACYRYMNDHDTDTNILYFQVLEA